MIFIRTGLDVVSRVLKIYVQVKPEKFEVFLRGFLNFPEMVKIVFFYTD